MPRGPRFTEQDIETIRIGAAAGQHPAAIAQALNRTETAVRAAATRRRFRWTYPGSRKVRGGSAAAGGAQGPRRRARPPRSIEDAKHQLALIAGGQEADATRVAALKAFIELERQAERDEQDVFDQMRADIRSWHEEGRVREGDDPPQVPADGEPSPDSIG